jgi:hypothetical protein
MGNIILKDFEEVEGGGFAAGAAAILTFIEEMILFGVSH